MTAKLKAYKVHDGDECTVIEFAAQNIVARKQGASEMCADWQDCECSRAPEFDSYAPGPVPTRALLEQGWWWDNGNERLTIEDVGFWDRHGQPHRNWSSWLSEQVSLFRDRGFQHLVERVVSEIVRQRWPSLSIVPDSGIKYLAPRQTFSEAFAKVHFPGCLFGMTVYTDGRATVPQSEHAAWREYCRLLKSIDTWENEGGMAA